MKGFFDTSVLVPLFYRDHVHHGPSQELFIQFTQSTGCCGAHSLAEVYATLTRMPGKRRISGEQAMLFIGNIRDRLGIIGGGIYDAMLAHCAFKAKAEAIYTWNTRHYALCCREVVARLRTP